MLRRQVALAAVSLILAGLLYATAVAQLSGRTRSTVQPEMLVSLPLFAQVLLAGGDRYLAANLSGFRVLVAATDRMHTEDYAVQARLQREIAWLNPAHQDNYYIAAAILPWNGHLDAAQYVLRRAGTARQNDWLPLFYLGFHYYHFLKNPSEGARWLLEAVPRVREQQDQWALQNLAAIWSEKGYSPSKAAAMVRAMAANAPAGAFRHYLSARAERLERLAKLRDLATLYRQKYGVKLEKIDELVAAGLIGALPDDPLGSGFELDKDGMPVFRKP